MNNAIFFILMAMFVFNSYAQNGSEVITKDVDVVIGRDLEEKIGNLGFEPAANRFLFKEEFLSYTYIPTTKTLFLRGLKPTPDRTDFIIFDNSGNTRLRLNIKVTATDQSKIVTDLREFLGDIEGIEIGIKGDTVYVGGKIIVPGDMGRIAIVLNKYKDVMSFVEISPQTQQIIAGKMQEEIQKSGMRDITVRVVNNVFWLEGMAGSEAQKERAMAIAQAYLPDSIMSLSRRTDSVMTYKSDPIKNFISVSKRAQTGPPGTSGGQKPAPPQKLVKVTAQFVELSKDYNKIFGFKWAPALAADGGSIKFGKTLDGGVTTKSDGTLAATISNLFPKLASAKSAGHARVIESGVVIVKDKQSGKISKSISRPFAVGTGEFTRASESNAGFNLDVKPTIGAEEKIDLGVGISVNFVIGDPPETTSNSITTSLVVKNKDSAVIGGVSVNKSATDFDRNPPGGKDQVEGGSSLFSFIKSRSYSTVKSQFAVFITPEVIESASSGAEDIKRKFRKRQR